MLQKAERRRHFAFEDRSSFADDWRRVFVLVSDEEMLVFDENGALLDEPDNGTPGGRQPLLDNGAGVGHDGKDFASEWQQGYYRLPSAESLGATLDDGGGGGGGGEIPPELLEPGARIKMAFGGGSSPCKWEGATRLAWTGRQALRAGAQLPHAPCGCLMLPAGMGVQAFMPRDAHACARAARVQVGFDDGSDGSASTSPHRPASPPPLHLLCVFLVCVAPLWYHRAAPLCGVLRKREGV